MVPEVIIFGGAFDPPHIGHRQCVAQAKLIYPQAKILIIPAGVPATASGKQKVTIASFEHRFAMCTRIFEGLPDTQVSTVERDLPVPNYTIRTIKHIQSKLDGSLALLIGQDQWESFHKWHQVQEIIDTVQILIVRRQHAERPSPPLKNHINLPGFDPNKHQLKLIDAEISPAESTIIRRHIAQKSAMDSDWLPATLVNYINRHGLYQAESK